MKCPLLIIATLSGQGRYDWAKSDCLKEECAWYAQQSERCCFTRIDEWLGEIGFELNCIKHALYWELGEEAEKEIIEEVAKD